MRTMSPTSSGHPFWAVALTVLGACSSVPAHEPSEVVRQHLEAVRKGDERLALSYLTEEGQGRAPTLLAPASVPPSATVHEVERAARWSGERELAVVRTKDGWRIARGVLALYSVESAEGALFALARALEAHDFARVHELIPTEARAFGGVAELKEKIDGHPAWMALAAAISAGKVGWVTREATQAEATIAVGGAEHRVLLKRAEGGWKVFDVLPRSGYLEPR